MSESASLCIPLEKIPLVNVERSGPTGSGVVNFRTAYGEDSSIMVATFSEGYFSRAHFHDSEQLNMVLEGELLFFVEEEGFRCRKGDLIRVPRNALHWTRVLSKTCTLLETQCPPLTGNPTLLGGAVALRRKDETFSGKPGVMNHFREYPPLEQIEARVMADLGIVA